MGPRFRRRSVTDVRRTTAGALPPRPASYRFVTLDPDFRLERRADLRRRAQVDGMLSSLRTPAQREAYLHTIRGAYDRTSVA